GPQEHVAEEVVEVLEMIAVDLPDEDRLVAADVHVDRAGHRVQPPRELRIGQLARSAFRHQVRGQVREALAARLVGGRARVEGDADRDERRAVALENDAGGVAERLAGHRLSLLVARRLGQARVLARLRRGPSAAERERDQEERCLAVAHHHHWAPPCARVTTKRRSAVRYSRATRATSSGVTAATAARYWSSTSSRPPTAIVRATRSATAEGVSSSESIP